MTPEEMLIEFHKAFGHPIARFPNLHRDNSVRELRMELLNEEFNEYLDAETSNDLVGVADALGDMLYIIYGTALAYGIPIQAVLEEIHRSNMSKLGLDNKPVYAENGKITKGPFYTKPNLRRVIALRRFEILAEAEDCDGFGWDFLDDTTVIGQYFAHAEPNAVAFAKSHAVEYSIQPFANSENDPNCIIKFKFTF
jgi:predicted HAD superfamily Cof-like phosphohydrolase